MKFLGGRIRLILGDSREVMGTMRAGSFDIIVSDPPYGIDYVSSAANHKALANDKNPNDIAGWSVPEMARLLKDDSAMYLCSRDDVMPVWWDHMKAAGVKCAPPIVWDKEHPVGQGSADNHMRQHEMILVGHKGSPKFQPWQWDLHLSSWEGHPLYTEGKVVRRDRALWRYPVPLDAATRAQHPTPKPPEIMERAIVCHTPNGEGTLEVVSKKEKLWTWTREHAAPWGAKVLDPFMGSGPVGVAAVRQRRRYVGVELEPSYYLAAVANVTAALEAAGLDATGEEEDWDF